MNENREDVKDYALKYVQINIKRIDNGLDFLKPADSEHLEIMAFVQHMLKLLNDLNELNIILGDFTCYDRIKYNIWAYRKMLNFLYSVKTGA